MFFQRTSTFLEVCGHMKRKWLQSFVRATCDNFGRKQVVKNLSSEERWVSKGSKKFPFTFTWPIWAGWLLWILSELASKIQWSSLWNDVLQTLRIDLMQMKAEFWLAVERMQTPLITIDRKIGDKHF